MEENRTKISIVVPVYNVAPFLGECIESLCKQTYSDIEIMLDKEFMTDEPSEVLEEEFIDNEDIKEEAKEIEEINEEVTEQFLLFLWCDIIYLMFMEKYKKRILIVLAVVVMITILFMLFVHIFNGTYV